MDIHHSTKFANLGNPAKYIKSRLRIHDLVTYIKLIKII